MDELVSKNLHFGSEVFIPITDAFRYLEDSSTVCHLEQLFYYYKGYAYDDYYSSSEYSGSPVRCYLDGISLIADLNLIGFWTSMNNELNYRSRFIELYAGSINGKPLPADYYDPNSDGTEYDVQYEYEINFSNVYVRKSDLDDYSKRYGIAKNQLWNTKIIHYSVPEKAPKTEGHSPVIDEPSRPQDSVIDEDPCPQDSVINFAKLVLIKLPNIKTADICKNCFEEMHDLNSRDKKIINDLLAKAGIRKSKQGEHAITIEWIDKYPKAQWMRVFNKKK